MNNVPGGMYPIEPLRLAEITDCVENLLDSSNRNVANPKSPTRSTLLDFMSQLMNYWSFTEVVEIFQCTSNINCYVESLDKCQFLGLILHIIYRCNQSSRLPLDMYQTLDL